MWLFITISTEFLEGDSTDLWTIGSRWEWKTDRLWKWKGLGSHSDLVLYYLCEVTRRLALQTLVFCSMWMDSTSLNFTLKETRSSSQNSFRRNSHLYLLFSKNITGDSICHAQHYIKSSFFSSFLILSKLFQSLFSKPPQIPPHPWPGDSWFTSTFFLSP